MKKRFLLAFADTEGMARKKSNLWNALVAVRYVVDVEGNQVSSINKVFHSSHLCVEQHFAHENVKKPLNCFFEHFNYLKKFYCCDKIMVCFWNAPHDKRVLSFYSQKLPFECVDLLKYAREFKTKHEPPIESFALDKLIKRFKLDVNGKTHTALGDTINMLQILPKLTLIDDENEIILSILNSKSCRPFMNNKDEKNFVERKLSFMSSTKVCKNDIECSKWENVEADAEVESGDEYFDANSKSTKEKRISDESSSKSTKEKCVTGADDEPGVFGRFYKSVTYFVGAN